MVEREGQELARRRDIRDGRPDDERVTEEDLLAVVAVGEHHRRMVPVLQGGELPGGHDLEHAPLTGLLAARELGRIAVSVLVGEVLVEETCQLAADFLLARATLLARLNRERGRTEGERKRAREEGNGTHVEPPDRTWGCGEDNRATGVPSGIGTRSA